MSAMIPDAGQEPDDRAAPKRPRVLLLSSDSPDSRALGGVALHIAALARNASAHVELFTAHPRRGELHVERWRPPAGGPPLRAGRLVAAVPLAPEGAAPGAGGAERALSAALAGTAADVLHVHSPLLEPAAIARAVRSSGVRLAVTLHDHALACENYMLLEGGERHCGIPEDLRRCDACLARTLGRAPGDVLRHRAKMRELASAADAFVAPSRSVLELCSRVHPEIQGRARRMAWGTPSSSARLVTRSSEVASSAVSSSGPLRIAFVGLLSKPKGRERLAPLLSACRALDVEWHVFGATEGLSLRDVERSAPRVILHGAYRREDLARRLAVAGCHLGFLPSVAAESFSLALSDVLAAGLPVLASDLGALAERVTEESLGWTFDPWAPETLSAVVSKLCADRTLVDDARARVRSRAVRTDADMARDHVKLWHGLAAAPRSRSSRGDVLALALFREGERRAHGATRSFFFPLVARLRSTLFYQDLRLRGLVSESRRKAMERAVSSLFSRARRR